MASNGLLYTLFFQISKMVFHETLPNLYRECLVQVNPDRIG